MIVVMKQTADADDTARVARHIEEKGFSLHISKGEARTIIGIIGANEHELDSDSFEVLPGVEKTMRIMQPFKAASRDFTQKKTVINVNGSEIGGERVAVFAGPCSVETREQILETAYAVADTGAQFLRGGAFKPRSSPYSFQGLGHEGLEHLAEAREKTGLSIITEVMSVEDIDLVEQYTDIFQVGARNTQNYPLLKALGRASKPVFLKRGLAGTLEELLMSAEYILSEGNMNVMLCERGIRTFETYTRNTFDVNAIPVLQNLTHLPVIADPAHGTGKWDLVNPISKSAVAAGADGVMIEVHPNPAQAKSDGAQSLTLKNFASLMKDLKRVAAAVDRSI